MRRAGYNPFTDTASNNNISAVNISIKRRKRWRGGLKIKGSLRKVFIYHCQHVAKHQSADHTDHGSCERILVCDYRSRAIIYACALRSRLSTCACTLACKKAVFLGSEYQMC